MNAMNEDTIPDSLKWINYLDMLTHGDITKANAVLKESYLYSMSQLLLWRYRDENYERQRKIEEMKIRSR